MHVHKVSHSLQSGSRFGVESPPLVREGEEEPPPQLCAGEKGREGGREGRRQRGKERGREGTGEDESH